MPKSVNKLDELLADAVLSSGPTRQVAHLALVAYKKSISEAQLKREILQITSMPELNYLQSIGVPKDIYQDFLNQIRKITTPGVQK